MLSFSAGSAVDVSVQNRLHFEMGEQPSPCRRRVKTAETSLRNSETSSPSSLGTDTSNLQKKMPTGRARRAPQEKVARFECWQGVALPDPFHELN